MLPLTFAVSPTPVAAPQDLRLGSSGLEAGLASMLIEEPGSYWAFRGCNQSPRLIR